MADHSEKGVNLAAMQRIFSNRPTEGRRVINTSKAKSSKLRAGKAAKTRRGKTRRV